ncbi:MAG: hypothetical protein ABJB40_02895 [Acidobacteriota bacterium]
MRSDIKTVSRKIMLMLAVLISILAGITLAMAQPGGKTPFTGVWETVSADSYRYTVRLTQIGNKVTGTYSPHNGKIFGGIVVGNKLTFKWTQDGDYEGTGEFTLDDDRKGFTGSSTATKPVPQTHTWNTYKPDPPSSFAGTWDLANNNGVRIPLTIVQNGSNATGLYPAQNGKLEGTVDGKILRFEWESNKGSGSGEFRISNSGQTFGVTFKKANGTEITESGTWGERPAAPDSSAPQKPALPAASGPVSFTGCWRLSGGLISAQTICLKQDEDGRVTDGDKFEGTISGNTLRFTHRPGESKNSGRLIMDKGGKSFRGFWHFGNDTELDDVPCTGITVHKPLGTGSQPFSGVWNVAEAGGGGVLVITQTGPVVTGVYGTNRGSFTLTNAHVTGNTLQFTVIGRSRSNPVEVGVLVLDAGGKLLTGSIGGNPMTGTFARPN